MSTHYKKFCNFLLLVYFQPSARQQTRAASSEYLAREISNVCRENACVEQLHDHKKHFAEFELVPRSWNSDHIDNNCHANFTI